MKTILITGGAIRIGREIACFLAQKKHKIIVHYNSSETAANELRNLIGCKLIKADFSNNPSVLKMIKKVGKIDVLINNASYFSKTKNLDNHYIVNYETPSKLITEFASINPHLKVFNVLDAWADSKPKGFEAYYQSRFLLENFKHPNITIHNFKLGATLIKDGQNPGVFQSIAEQFPNNLEKLKSTLSVLYC